MGTLLEKIQKQKRADSADLRKTSCNTVYMSGERAENVRKSLDVAEKSANPQTVQTLKPLPCNTFRKSANPHEKKLVPDRSVADLSSNSQTEFQESSSALMRKLVSSAILSGVFEHGLLLEEKEIAALVPPADWREVTNCSPGELQAWAAALAMRAVRYRGKIPAGWSKVAHCKECGPVYSFHDQDTLSCGWCDMTRAGKPFPRPIENEST